MNSLCTLHTNPMKILITGGAGFIGSNLCEYFLQQGHYVRCFDNFSTGKWANISALLDSYPQRMELQVGDVRNREDCARAVVGMEYVLHEAALGSVPRSFEDPITTNEVNVSGFLHMLMAAQEAHVKRFVYAASSSAYGDSERLPKVEEEVGEPLSPYAITKRMNELYASVLAQSYSIETIGLRYFNVFGRRQAPHSMYAAVIPLFIKKLIAHEAPLIHGDGTYSRDFTYIDNVIQMNALALATTNPRAINQVYNTAFGERTTLNQLVEYLKINLAPYDAAIASIEPLYGAHRTGDIPHSWASIEKAKQLLGYRPHYSLQQGLAACCDWYWHHL